MYIILLHNPLAKLDNLCACNRKFSWYVNLTNYHCDNIGIHPLKLTVNPQNGRYPYIRLILNLRRICVGARIREVQEVPMHMYKSTASSALRNMVHSSVTNTTV
jgi:hypothetical protein